MNRPQSGESDEWNAAREELLAREKEHTRLGHDLTGEADRGEATGGRRIQRAVDQMSRSGLGDRSAEAFEVDVGGFGPAAYAGVERVDRGEFGVAQLEVEDVEVLGDALRAYGLWDCGSALLQVPAQHHLRG
jgi:hypothetical protein